MKKFAIGILIALMLMSVSAFATQQRVHVMGDNDMIILDDYNVKRFPGRINNYPDLALGEFSPGGDGFFDNEFYEFGVHWQFNEDNPWVLGTYISTWPRFGPTAHARFPNSSEVELANLNFLFNHEFFESKSSDLAGGPGDFGVPRRIELIYGRQLGGHNFGFSLDIVRASREFERDSLTIAPNTPGVFAKQSFSQFTFGLGLTEGTSGQWDVALNFLIGSWTDENAAGLEVTKPNGYFDAYLQGRYFWVRNPKVTLVPHAKVAIGKRGVDENIYFSNTDTLLYVDTWESKRTAIDLGIGMNYTTGPDMLAVLDFGFMLNSVKWEFTDTDTSSTSFNEEEKYTTLMAPYVKIGFEGEVFSWMDFRAGGSTTLWINQEKSEFTDADPTENDFTEKLDFPMNRLWLGTGFHFGKLHVDTYMDPEILINGFNFISGNSEELNFAVSVLYELF